MIKKVPVKKRSPVKKRAPVKKAPVKKAKPTGKKIAKKTKKTKKTKKKKKRSPLNVKKGRRMKRKPPNAKSIESLVAAEVVSVLDVAGDDKSYKTLRWMAGQYYATNLNQCSTADIHKHPVFAVIPKQTLEKWCTSDGWVEQRHIVQEKIKSKVSNALANEVVQMRSAQLKTMHAIFEDAIGNLLPKQDEDGNIVLPNKPPVKSYEGLINAVTKLAGFLDDTRERLGEIIAPNISFEGESDVQVAIGVKPKLTQGEARAAAKLLIEMRQADMSRRQETPEILDKPGGG